MQRPLTAFNRFVYVVIEQKRAISYAVPACGQSNKTNFPKSKQKLKRRIPSVFEHGRSGASGLLTINFQNVSKN